MSLIRTPYEVTPVTPGQTTDAFESFFVSGLHTVILNGGIERLLHCIYYVYITIVIIIIFLISQYIIDNVYVCILYSLIIRVFPYIHMILYLSL